MNAQTICGSTRLVALLGHPVAHSISPQIHNHGFATLGLPFAYIPLDTPIDRLGGVVDTLRQCRFAGANVTIPLKQAVVTFCDHISDESRMTGAVNTLYFDNNANLCGTTTDSAGFLRALDATGYDPDGARIVIVGNGGTARTLSYALAARKIPAALTLVGRNRDRVCALADEVRDRTCYPVVGFGLDSAACSEAIAEATLLVNCTNAGMHPNTDQIPLDPSLLHPALTVFDTIYNPVTTRLLDEAVRVGCAVSNGLLMLLHQGLESFRYWTGVDAPVGLFDPDELQRQICG